MAMTTSIARNSFFAKVSVLAVVLAVTIAFGPADLLAQDSSAGSTHFNAYVENYVEVFYDKVPLSPAQWVFYRGETIIGRAGLLNPSRTTELRVVTPPGRALSAEWLTVPEPRRLMEVVLPVFRDVISLQASGFPTLVGSGREQIVPASSIISSEFEIDTTDLPEGLYRLALYPVDWQADRPIHLARNVIAFEIRDADETSRYLDLFARKARRALDVQDFQLATVAVNQMLARHPDCALAYTLRGQIAERRGRRSEAADAYSAAAAIVRGQRDVFYEQRPRPRPR